MVIRNTIKYLRELFNIKKRYDNCLYCSKQLKRRRRKFCSTLCNNNYWKEVYKGEIKRNKPKHTLYNYKGGQK